MRNKDKAVRNTFVVTSLLLLITARVGWAQDVLRALSMEDLVNIEVTTVSRTPETRTMVPAAVHVITEDEIRRSGAQSIPEILRLVPGMQVARIDSNKWAVGIRGFTERLSRSMLVMIDGRAVYSPLFAGTYWELQDTLLDDIDRIEIIRGPGGTLWGSNAVNGIVNIITKSAANTQGGVLKVGGGTMEQEFGSVRYGGKIGHSFHYRGYGKFFNRDAAFHHDGNNYDDWRMGRLGFRTDWTSASNRTLTFSGDFYTGAIGQFTTLTTYGAPFTQRIVNDSDVSGGNIVGRWQGPVGRTSDFKLQLYYDRTNRKEVTFRENRDTFDTDFQHTLGLTDSQRIVWGVGYRASSGRTDSVPAVRFIPANRTDHLFSFFAQDELRLATERVRVTLGSKFEHNGYSGLGVQPSARVVYAFSADHAMVFSVSRAVRTPSRLEHDLELTSQIAAPTLPVAAFLRIVPNREFDSEKLIAYEAGYRTRPANRLFLTASAFLNQHDDLLSTELKPAFFESNPPPNHAILPANWANGLHGNSYGLELTADVRLTERWRWTGFYSFLSVRLTPDHLGSDASQERLGEGNSPRHQSGFKSSMDLPAKLELDAMFRYVSSLPAPAIPPYTTVDLRLAWRPKAPLELSIVGRNLFDPQHPEFSGGVEIQRHVRGQMTWRW